MKQCQAHTLPSTYSASHRCLKPSTGKPVAKKRLCAHHRGAAARKSA